MCKPFTKNSFVPCEYMEVKLWLEQTLLDLTRPQQNLVVHLVQNLMARPKQKVAVQN